MKITISPSDHHPDITMQHKPYHTAKNKHRGDFKRQMRGMMIYVAMYAVIYALFIHPVYGVIQLFTALTIPLLGCAKWLISANTKSRRAYFFLLWV